MDKNGSASYDIEFPRAWDTIEITDADKKLVESSDAIVFGSLIARNTTSKNTLISLLEYAKYKIFDVNLRPPHYNIDVLVELMKKADFLKLNDDELNEICKKLGYRVNLDQMFSGFRDKDNIISFKKKDDDDEDYKNFVEIYNLQMSCCSRPYSSSEYSS